MTPGGILGTLHSESLLNALAFVLPLAGIALSWWSFRWTEEGATPDSCGIEYFGFQGSDVGLQVGQRYRARWCARTCFNAGALLLAASVPMGTAGSHALDRINLSALSGLLIIGVTAIYAILQLLAIWRSRRSDAFGLYFSKEMFSLYDRDKTARIYFRENRMHVWSIVDRRWFEKRKLPNIDEVYLTASKARVATAP